MKAFHSDRRGGVATTAAVLLLTLLVGVAAAVNVSRLNAAGNELQDLADAAALTAALELREGKADAAAAARVDALARPMQAAFKASRPAQLQMAVNGRDPVDVTVTGRQPFAITFGGVLGLDNTVVRRSARAVVDASAPVCLLLLEQSAPRAWSMAGSPSVSGGDCVAQVNSKASGAITDQGAAAASVMATHVVG
ncbi:MAG TPA: pilus assembly protein TadG-related protein, partial [Roseococcus sp.]|nr:pilus assembly protein TadG-related protein [Roseococcus sp.]